MSQFRIRMIRVPRWQIFLVAAFIIALLATLFVVAIGAFLIIFPIVVLVGAIAYLFGLFRAGPRRERADPRVIETEYREVDPDRPRVKRERK